MSSPTASFAEHDLLLATKLHVPRLRPGFVARPRLLERLAEGIARELVLVCTPAGFGKTSLLADWATGGQRRAAWLSLDEGDNDPARFWRHAAAALDGVCPGVADRVGALLRGPRSAGFEAVVAALVNELAGVAEQVVLVLDDYHLIQAPPIHTSFGFLLDHLPGSLRLVVASRTDPPLPLARLRAGGQLAELRAAELRFTPGEAAQLLRQAVGADVTEAVVAALEDRTEGWVAGLQLAALSLGGHADPVGFVATFSGSHRYVLDYLAEEVLDRQPEHVRGFLLATSVLERLSGPLCETVTGRGDSQQLLEAVERANLFLVPLDEVRGWWRYHQLFADLLRARLQQAQPERVPGLHQAAAAWCEQHGLVDEAIRHALRAGDGAWAARLVEAHIEELLMRGEGGTVRGWLDRLPAELASSRPRLLLARARLALVSGRVEAVEAPLDAAEHALAAAADVADEPYEPSIGRAASTMANLPATIALDRAFLAILRGDAEAASVFASRAQAQTSHDEWMLDAYTHAHLAVAEWLRGRLAEAEHALAANIAQWQAAGERFLAVRVSEILGQAQRAQGHLDAALGTYQKALELAAPPGREALPAAGIAHVGMAEVAYQRGELDAALVHAAEGIALCRQLAYTQPLATGLATLAWIRQAEGDRAGALDAIGEAERVQLSSTVVGLLNPVPTLQARLALAHGQVAKAARWARARGLAPDNAPSYSREREYLVLARVLLASDAPDRALALLARLHAHAVAQGRAGSVIEVQALQALALAATGDETGALAALAEALALAAPGHYQRLFIDEGIPMATLLGKLARATTGHALAATPLPEAYVGWLLAAFRQAGAPIGKQGRRAAAMVPGLPEPLTAREREVLALLAVGKPNQAIAEELVITLDTVKRHVTHILDKLGVTNRTQAVTRARELGLLR